MVKKTSFVVSAAAVLCLAGSALIVACGDEKPAPAKVDPAASAAPAAPSTPLGTSKAPDAAKTPETPPSTSLGASKAAEPAMVLKAGSIGGTVKIKGEAPRRRKIKMDADPKCAALHADSPLMDDIVVDAQNNVQWAFVYVKKGAEGKGTKPEAPAMIDQKGCRYEPHVFGVMAGQDIIIRNSDELLHNIHALPFSNKEFNIGQPSKGLEEKKQFNTPEIMVKIKCDVHPWMSAWVGVCDHPFFAVTDASGKFEIKNLPDGKYTIEAWHERYKSVSAEVTLAGTGVPQNFELVDKKE